jgi:hypothetical protein
MWTILSLKRQRKENGRFGGIVRRFQMTYGLADGKAPRRRLMRVDKQ